MPATRRSARIGDASSSPVSSPAKGNSKRKATDTPTEKEPKVQKTLEETINGDAERDEKPDAEEPSTEQDVDMKSEEPPSDAKNGTTNGAKQDDDTNPETEKAGASKPDDQDSNNKKNEVDLKASNTSDHKSAQSSEQSKSEENGNLVEDKTAREDEVASNIIEKGIIYFFTRGRVNVNEPEGVQDLQRTYFVLRPIPVGAKLGEGPIDDSNNNRLIALPKKVFPKSGKDRFMAFVEKGKASMSALKEEFFQGSDYQTKTGDQRHTPSIMPVGEGVYAITKTGRTGHLAYMLSIPKEPGELQDEMGICSKGSFALSLKNPKNKGPANTQLPESPDFPKDIMDDFGGLAWMPVHKSEYLDYPNAQILLIGEGHDKFGGAAEGEKDGDSPEKELETLEAEDQVRVEALHGEDAVYADLHIRKADYPEVKTTW